MAQSRGWRITGVLNNDMIGNVEGSDGISDTATVRVFSEGTSPTEERVRTAGTAGHRRRGGRRLATAGALREAVGDRYVPALDVWLIYRLDRFGRGGHHRPFADLGYPAVRLMETHENYDRQHQNIRQEGGVAYGDVIEGVDFGYARKITALDAAVLASLSWAPGPPRGVRLGGRGAARRHPQLGGAGRLGRRGGIPRLLAAHRLTDLGPLGGRRAGHQPSVRRAGGGQLVLRRGEREPRRIHEPGGGVRRGVTTASSVRRIRGVEDDVDLPHALVQAEPDRPRARRAVQGPVVELVQQLSVVYLGAVGVRDDQQRRPVWREAQVLDGGVDARGSARRTSAQW